MDVGQLAAQGRGPSFFGVTRMSERLNRTTPLFIATIVVAAAAATPFAAALSSSVPIAVHQADQVGGAYYYTYHKQIKPLALDTSRIAIRADDVEVLKVALVATKLGQSSITPHAQTGWYLLSDFGKADGATIEQMVIALAAHPAVLFAAPVFFDDFGGPMFPMQDLIVGFTPGQNKIDRDAMIDAALAVTTHEHDWMPDVDRATSKDRNGFEVLNASNSLAALPQTLFAEPDMMFTGHHHATPNDPMYGDLWGLNNTGQLGGMVNSDMNIAEAWDVTAGSSAIINVVIDVGVDLTHPDLNLFAPSNDLTGNGTLGGPGNNCDNHGTAVAGCIAARINNSLGVVGAAPGCRVASARCFVSNLVCDGSWSGTASFTVNALTWAQSIGARVTNNSNGYGFTSASIDTAYSNTRNAGIIHFASAGNNGTGIIGYPASLPTVDAVAAMDRFGNRAGFSQFGVNLAFCAPGVAIGSTDRQGAFGYSSNDYNVVDGTSFASPYASAVACLILSRNSALNVAQVESIMQNSIRDLGPAGYDTGFGYGYVNAQGALNLMVPAGDGCSSAVNVGNGGTFFGTLVGATNPSPVSTCGSAGGNPDVWYRFVAPMAGTLTAATCGTNDNGGTNIDTGIDTVVSMHASCTGASLSCSDDGGCGLADAGIVRDSSLTRPVSAGEAILIRVSKFGGTPVGTFVLTISFVAANDPCAGALDVSSGGTFFGNLAFTTNDSTLASACGASQTNPDAWYIFTAPATCAVTLTATTCGTSDGAGVDTGMDTVLSLHTTCGAEPTTCNDDSAACGSLDTSSRRDSVVSRPLAAGESVLIRVSKFSSVTSGPFRLNISASPTNDLCINATTISAGIAIPFCTNTANTDGPAEVGCNNGPGAQIGNDLWYRYTTSGAGRFTARTCGSAFDTKLAIYSNTCPTIADTALACNDDAFGLCPSSGLHSSASAFGTANTSYLIRVGGFSSFSGSGVVTVYCAADINFSGTVSVQDIFDFLSLYFANNPAADLNGSGAISVQDIFDFLAGYFVGCV